MVKITDTRGKRTTAADREKRDRELAEDRARRFKEHADRNAAALAEEQRVAALTPEQRRAEREAHQADVLKRHADANAAAIAAEAERSTYVVATDRQAAKAAAGPPENKALDPAVQNKSTDFASDEAAELAAAEGLTDADFRGKKPSGKNGFTVADVRALLGD